MEYFAEAPATTRAPDAHRLLAYIADLELEVDHLRKQGQFVQHEVRDTLKRVRLLCAEARQPTDSSASLAAIDHAAGELAVMLHDVREPAGYHPAHDQVVAIAVRPLVEQVFRWQQRLAGAPQVELRLELQSDHVEWFPARLRHILDNLISNALKYRDPAKSEAWVTLGLRTSPTGYELRISDNGIGLRRGTEADMWALFSRAAPVQAAGLGVGLAVVKLLVEQSGGTLHVDSDEGQGTTFVAVLPRYDVADFLT
jgi:signal transduction histidine kinase